MLICMHIHKNTLEFLLTTKTLLTDLTKVLMLKAVLTGCYLLEC